MSYVLQREWHKRDGNMVVRGRDAQILDREPEHFDMYRSQRDPAVPIDPRRSPITRAFDSLRYRCERDAEGWMSNWAYEFDTRMEAEAFANWSQHMSECESKAT